MGEFYIAGQAAIWLQRHGPNTKPEFLGCHALEDIEDPGDAGEVTLLYCPDPADVTRYKVSGSYVTPATDPVSTTISTRVKAAMDLIEKAKCRGNLFLHKFDCGRRDLFSNYQRSFILQKYQKGPTTYGTMASMQPDDEEASSLSAELQAESLVKVVPVSGGRESIAAVGDLYAVAPLYTAQCPGDCGGLIEDGDWLVAVGSALDGSAAATADVWIKQGAAGWAAAAADPFGGGEGIAAVVVVPISSTVNRIIVARGTPDAGNPAEIAYSDDLGATWTAVNVGAVNGQFMAGPGALFAIDQYNIWAVTSGGYIYKSEDGGLTWTAQESGVLAAQTFYQVKFLSTSFGVVAGDANSILVTTNGGTTWSLVTGPAGQAAQAIMALAIVTERRWFLGYGDGELWYTEDAGTTWAQRRFSGDGVGTMQSISFANEMVGMMLHDNASPVGAILRTIDGGYSWDAVSTPANAGLNAIHVFDPNLAVAVGNVSGTTAVVVAVTE